MKKKFLIVCIGLLAVATVAQATPIESISATTAVTTFVSVGGTGVLSMVGMGGINVEDIISNVTTYTNGSFSLFTILASDASSGGIASGNFSGGAFSYNDSSSAPLLSGSIVSLNLTEFSNGSGIFVGNGSFVVTGGSLQGDFGAVGSMVNISFSVNPKTIADFSTSFSASSNMTVQSIPEPATIALLIPAILALRNRRNNKK